MDFYLVFGGQCVTLVITHLLFIVRASLQVGWVMHDFTNLTTTVCQMAVLRRWVAIYIILAHSVKRTEKKLKKETNSDRK